MKLKGARIVITGGQRVGQYVAAQLQQAGAEVVMSYRASEAEVAPGTTGHQLDVTSEQSVRAFWSAVGQADGLVNMVSVFTEDQASVTYEHFSDTFMVNAFGNMLLSNLFATAAREADAVNRPIVSFIDWAVDHPYSKYGIYLAAKAALRHYLMALQTSCAGAVRVVNIHPGMILEPPDFPADEKAEIVRHTPAQDIGSPEQAAELVQTALKLDYLVDNIYLDGGQHWRHRLVGRE